jgi:hypothetical protein
VFHAQGDSHTRLGRCPASKRKELVVRRIDAIGKRVRQDLRLGSAVVHSSPGSKCHGGCAEAARPRWGRMRVLSTGNLSLVAPMEARDDSERPALPG